MLSRQTLDTIISIAKMEIDPVTDKEYALLAEDIMATTGESLGINTLKRMFGRVNDQTKATQKSLNIVARYLGYVDWNNYMTSLQLGAVHTFNINELGRGDYKHIYVDGLSHGAVVSFRFEPDGKMKLLYIGDYRFRVLHSTSNVISVGDILIIYAFEDGRRLTARKVDCTQGNSLQGIAIGCLNGGVSYIRIE